MAVSHECSGSKYLSVFFLLTRSFRRLMKKVQVLNKYNIIWCFPENYRKPFSGIFLKRFWNCCTLKSLAVTSLFNLVVSWISEFLGWLTIANTDLIVRWQAYKNNSVRSSVFDNYIVIIYRMWKSSICFNSRWRIMELLTPGARSSKVAVN